MLRPFVLAALLFSITSSAATISSSTCPGSGCNVSYVSGTAHLSIQVTGTWSGSIVFEGSHDNNTYVPLRAYPAAGGPYVAGLNSNGAWLVPTSGLLYFRSRATAWTAGVATLTSYSSTAGAPADSVQATVQTPDGGLPVAVGGVVAVSSPDGGLPVTPGAATVSTVLTTPDGGLPVSLGAATVSTVLMTPDGGLPVAVDAPVRVVGPTFGEVQVSGVVDLSSATLASMGNYVCTSAEAHRLSLTTTPTIIPTTPIANRTSWTLINVDTVGTKTVACRVDPGDGGVPDCTTPGFGLTVFPNGGTLTFPVRESDTVRCRACTATTTVEHVEEACVAP